MKAYTDLEQSKKLAEFLPLESADGFWEYQWYEDDDEGYGDYPRAEPYLYYSREENEWKENKSDIPCWSLAALLDILTEQDFIIKNILNDFNIDIPIRHCKIWFPSLLDAAFEMVCWLKEN